MAQAERAVFAVNGEVPSETQLRAAARALFASPETADERARAMAGRWPGALLRAMLAEGDAALLAAALRQGFFSRDALDGALCGEAPLPFSLRLLLAHPELADALAPPVPEVSPSTAEAGPGEDADLVFSRWQFAVGAALPFLRRSVMAMVRRRDGRIEPFGTDGLDFYTKEDTVSRLTDADLQHVLIHCVFRHTVPPKGSVRSVWDLACDISCEYLRSELFPFPGGAELRLTVEDVLPPGCDPRSAPAVAEGLMDLFADELAALAKRFRRDDHRFWYTPARPHRPGQSIAGAGAASDEDTVFDRSGGGDGGRDPDAALSDEELEELLAALRERSGERWRELDRRWEKEKKPTHRYGLSPGSREEKMLLREEGKYDFSRYLRRFSVLREEMQLDLNSFDYIPYYYGLQRYGNMPLLEPPETTESYKIHELVIAIDTSGSCSRETVLRFLSEIEHILMQKENFFRKMHLHIIQCDALIQDDTEIRSLEEWKKYKRELRIRGRGGTSFVPVFTLVEKLQERGNLRHLKGLLYFTDGDGVYPVKKTPYETAFVFSDRHALERRLPEWITPLLLDGRATP